MEYIIIRMQRVFDLTYSLCENFEEVHLGWDLKGLPSNKIGGQFWCVVGARESYLSAIKKSKWMGFDCSLKQQGNKREILRCLRSSAADVIDFLDQNDLTHIQKEWVLDLLEHEVQHHGQFIRYVYGNKLTFPDSWNKRYTV